MTPFPHYVEESTARVMEQGKYDEKLHTPEQGHVTWDSGNVHYFHDVKHDGPSTCQYVFVLDALNFCFWPTEKMDYEHLASGLKMALVHDSHAFDAEKLAIVTNDTMKSWFQPFTPPQVDERRQKVQEMGKVLIRFFHGRALNLIKQADFSAIEAVRLVLAYFPRFRDHAV
ncbi:unnamed protein product [Peronospora belbahrii]|uniref:Queuosine 5'-phosphate N-glycosylase/hydrolase n=1 Tax=Peronospora belbahrii TaxID=622444 RepID=A0ABN8D9E6_9STRA|nr:unnamed protein product [Peronospora belbahrii]